MMMTFHNKIDDNIDKNNDYDKNYDNDDNNTTPIHCSPDAYLPATNIMYNSKIISVIITVIFIIK